MLVKITAKRQVTFPARILDAMGAKPGDYLEVCPAPGGFLLKPRRIDESRLAPLKELIPADHPTFNISDFREATYAPELRD